MCRKKAFCVNTATGNDGVQSLGPAERRAARLTEALVREVTRDRKHALADGRLKVEADVDRYMEGGKVGREAREVISSHMHPARSPF